MKTKKQQELIDSFLSGLDAVVEAPLYRDIVMCLSGLGYFPRKQRSYTAFKHSLHNREMVKMGMTKNNSPYLALKFSACKRYSRKFADVIGDYIAKNPKKLFPHCEDGKCIFRADGDRGPVYEYTTPDGLTQYTCGTKLFVIPDITVEDVVEITRLVKEEHEWLTKH